MIRACGWWCAALGLLPAAGLAQALSAASGVQSPPIPSSAPSALPVQPAADWARWQPTSLSQVWVNAGFYSLHYDHTPGLRNQNPGIGVEWPVSPMVSLTAGRFHNSDRALSNYIGAYVMPWRVGSWRFGAVAGAFDGYPKAFDRGWFPALIPVAAFEDGRWGLNLGFVPSMGHRLHGSISLQLKFRWERPD